MPGPVDRAIRVDVSHRQRVGFLPDSPAFDGGHGERRAACRHQRPGVLAIARYGEPRDTGIVGLLLVIRTRFRQQTDGGRHRGTRSPV